jgi:3D (Asp-Asp-Asp) domain-containing protein
MNKGAKVATNVIAFTISALMVYGGGTLYSQAAEAPGLESKVQVLEQNVKEERLINNGLTLKNKELVNYQSKLISYNYLVLDKLDQSKIRIRELENEIAQLKKQKELKKLTGFEITWYNDTGTTKSGRETVDGTTISVDPKVIPLGTWVRIVFPDGKEITRRADDTGSKVKGKIIDVYKKDSTSSLKQLGRTYGATVYILDK